MKRPTLHQRRRFRGAATTETAVLMLVLVPLIFYTLFLEDVLIYKLDLAESVFTSVWDFAHNDYRHQQNIAPSMQHFNRLTYADHSSAWNTYSNEEYDKTSTEHHQSLAAHECWLAQGAEQITCTLDPSVGQQIASEFQQFNRGGQGTCKAILGVENYFIPQKLFQWFAKQDLTQQKRWTGGPGTADIHGNAQQDPYVFPEETFSALFDPWALNWIKSAGSNDTGTGHSAEGMHGSHPQDQGSEWTSWMKKEYSDRGNYVQKAKAFADDAIQKKVLSNLATMDVIGDNLDTPPLAWNSQPQRQVQGYTTSGWQDQRHQNTQRAMQNAYMGKNENEW